MTVVLDWWAFAMREAACSDHGDEGLTDGVETARFDFEALPEIESVGPRLLSAL
jgi:hypothetical protein